jgi:hypothetical protein
MEGEKVTFFVSKNNYLVAIIHWHIVNDFNLECCIAVQKCKNSITEEERVKKGRACFPARSLTTEY